MPPSRITRPDCIDIGSGVTIHEGAWLSVVQAHADIVPRLVIGDGTRIGRGVNVACIGKIVIGRDVVLADDVFIGDCYHDYRDPHVPVINQPMSKPASVVIGDGATLGCGAIVLPGVTVGAGAHVGTGAVVTSDVPPEAAVIGNPARPAEGRHAAH